MYAFYSRKITLFLCVLFVSLAAFAQSYEVKGGEGTPLLAKEDKPNRLEVYVVHGAKDVLLTYTSASSSHTWYRFKTKALEAEPVESEQNGTTSTVKSPEEGYGYFVKEANIMHQRYVWLVDYAAHPISLNTLTLAEGFDACSSLRLAGDLQMDKIVYHQPTTGIPMELKRRFEVSYSTLEWDESMTDFKEKDLTETVEGNPFEVSLLPPLCDTQITLSGDHFAKHFGKEQSRTIEHYSAVAVEAHGDTLFVPDESEYLMTEGEGFSAPATISFTAVANEPVAALYIWKIYSTEEGVENPLIRFTGSEIEYTFTRFGEYTAELEVADRSGVCKDNSQSFTFQIMESGLKIPNTFTPGTSPGVNDFFQVKYKSLISFKGTIFNRWGTELFHWTNPAEGWDGKKGNRYVPPGVYFYVIEAEGSDGIKYLEKGDINVIRPKEINDEIIEE